MQVQFFKFLYRVDGREMTFKCAAETEAAAAGILAEYYSGRGVEILAAQAGRWATK